MKQLLSILLFSLSAMVLAQEIKETLEFSEDFKNFEVGSFPKLNWGDITQKSIPATAPSPSCAIIETTNHNGETIKALQFKRGVSTSCGIYREIENINAKVHIIKATVRVDHWSNSSTAFFTDWAVAFGWFSIYDGYDFNAGPQITFVAQPVSDNWVLYALRSDVKNYSEYYNEEFPEKVKLNSWYNITMELNQETGCIGTEVEEVKTGVLIHKKETFIPEWNAEKSGNFKYFGAWDGEYNTDATAGNQVTISKISLSTR